ncbi:MAG: hypothetical protein AAFQ61_10055 [Cyanobacteria bacterium J06626_23]
MRYWIAKRILGLCLVIALVWAMGLLPVQAETSFLTSRVNQLESRLSSLSSQLSQLQSQVARLSGRPASPPQSAPQPTNNTPSLEAQFDNLAILTIELRDQIIALETRVTELEAALE